MSGLSASGKTTLGKMISKKLDYSFLDKDDYLVDIFERMASNDKKV